MFWHFQFSWTSDVTVVVHCSAEELAIIQFDLDTSVGYSCQEVSLWYVFHMRFPALQKFDDVIQLHQKILPFDRENDDEHCTLKCTRAHISIQKAFRWTANVMGRECSILPFSFDFLGLPAATVGI